jgi:hypothetical protein
MGEDGRWIFLEIVGRKHVVMRRNKGLEKPPGRRAISRKAWTSSGLGKRFVIPDDGRLTQ